MSGNEALSVATFGSGCFWCTEAVFWQLRGVRDVKSGYSGGTTVDPTYEEVCTGQTGHAECARIRFDPAAISYADLLQVFFQTHDPTTLNRQGNDVGTQYRSVIFWHDPQQRQTAQQTIDQLNESAVFADPIVTTLEPAAEFYEAESYHQEYYTTHPSQPYCLAVIRPKIDKFRIQYRDLLKPQS